VQCSVCGSIFPEASQLLVHLRIHSGAKPFMCAECGRQFTRRGHLGRHMRLHSGEKPFMCNRCACQFARADHLRRHMQSHLAENSRSKSSSGTAISDGEIRIKPEVDDGDSVETDSREIVKSNASAAVAEYFSVAHEAQHLSGIKLETDISSLLAATCVDHSSSNPRCSSPHEQRVGCAAGSDLIVKKEQSSVSECASAAENNCQISVDSSFTLSNYEGQMSVTGKKLAMSLDACDLLQAVGRDSQQPNVTNAVGIGVGVDQRHGNENLSTPIVYIDVADLPPQPLPLVL
jgi:uncharacterized Zn-finger protein